MHLFHVEGPIIGVGIILMEWVFASADLVVIGARECIKASVRFGLYFPNAVDDDVVGKKNIEAVGQLLAIVDFTINIEMGIIVSCVNSCIRSSAACDANGLV